MAGEEVTQGRDVGFILEQGDICKPVSYTNLTLPTICSV